jgi:hypothetical protein
MPNLIVAKWVTEATSGTLIQTPHKLVKESL